MALYIFYYAIVIISCTKKTEIIQRYVTLKKPGAKCVLSTTTGYFLKAMLTLMNIMNTVSPRH